MILKLTDKIKAYRTRSEESGSAIIFALILLIVTFSLVSTVTAFGLANLQKTLFVQSYTNNGLAAETAISDALMVANSQGGTKLLSDFKHKNGEGPSVSPVVKGEVSSAYSSGNGGQKWVWYTERVSDSSAVAQYYIHAWGFQNTPSDPYARHFRVKVASYANMKAAKKPDSTQITYYPDPDAVSQWGLLGSSAFTVNPGANLKSYISDIDTDATKDTRQGQIGSNGVVNMSSDPNNAKFFFGDANAGNSSRRINLLNWSAADELNPLTNRCAGCSNAEKQYYDVVTKNYRTDLTTIATTVETACPLQTYPVWKSSENNGVLVGDCYNSLIFDQDTTTPSSATEDTPAVVYIKGDVTVNAGVKVNYGKSPLALRIYSQGGQDAKFNQGTIDTPTRVSAYIAGSVLRCTDGTDSTSVQQGMKLYFYGSLACDTINIGGGTQIWWDELSANLSGSGESVRRLWYTVEYEELYKG